MAKPPKSTLTKKSRSATEQSSRQPLQTGTTRWRQHVNKVMGWSHVLIGLWIGAVGLVSFANLRLVSFLEKQSQSMFYEFRGEIPASSDILILSIDDDSISIPENSFRHQPQEHPYFQPIHRYPYQRAAYAQVIDQLVDAGAKVVALDVLFDTKSSYGDRDDEIFAAALKRHADRVVLAAVYEEYEQRSQQLRFTQLTKPHPRFLETKVAVGSVNFPREIDGKVHRLASEYQKELARAGDLPVGAIPDFDVATLRAANIPYPQPQGERIYFRGGAGTFTKIPFWYVFDPNAWSQNLQNGKVFRDKIVIIGATNKLNNDYHQVAANWLFPQLMSGVEIHANAIATLLEGNALRTVIDQPWQRGLFVLIFSTGCALVAAKFKQMRMRIIISWGSAIIWMGISFVLFVSQQIIIPTAIPAIALLGMGTSYIIIGISLERKRKLQLARILQKNPSSRVVQEILSQQEDLRELLRQREIEVSGKIIDNRYKIVRVLGSGGFSETYIAEDSRRPGSPHCVVKLLRPASNKPEQLEVARRLFASEGETLQKLGNHPQIPQLLAFFEEDEDFYLVQEYIEGKTLNQELIPHKRFPERTVIEIVTELLEILTFVHQNGVIHRDIKPSNIIRRQQDKRLVLIDFGAVKQISSEQPENPEQTAFTIGIGTKGYAPPEQCFGRPSFSSDIYAVGMIGIKALTSISPQDLKRDQNGQLQWQEYAPNTSPEFTAILNKMVHESYKARYQSAAENLTALKQLINSETFQLLPKEQQPRYIPEFDNVDLPTQPWEP